MNQRLQFIPAGQSGAVLEALKPKPGQLRLLFPMRENRRSIALQEYAKRNRGAVVIQKGAR